MKGKAFGSARAQGELAWHHVHAILHSMAEERISGCEAETFGTYRRPTDTVSQRLRSSVGAVFRMCDVRVLS